MTIYGYARVSTDKQTLADQTKTLEESGCTKIFKEKKTGTSLDKRPQFKKLLETIQEGDTLTVAKLDRFARSTQDGLNMVDMLLKKGVAINILDMGKFDNTPQGQLLRTMMFAFAQFERDMIVARTQAGRNYYKSIGKTKKGDEWHDGRPALAASNPAAYDRCCEMLRLGVSPSKIARDLKIGRTTVYKIKNTLTLHDATGSH